jgi:hypothetical protein
MISLVTEFTSLMNAVTSSLNYQYPGTLWAFLPLFLVIATYLMPSIIALINNKRPFSVAILRIWSKITSRNQVACGTAR